MDTKALSLNEILKDKTLYPRFDVGWPTVLNYKEAMQMGAKFPPITVTPRGEKYILVDGWHRLAAIKQLGQDEVQAEVLQPLSDDEIYIESVKRNIAAQRPLSFLEKLEIQKRLKAKGYKLKFISNLLFIPANKLTYYHAKRAAYLKSGSELPSDILLHPPLAHLSGQTVTDPAYDTVKASINQVTIISQLITIVRNKWLDSENPKVMALIAELKQLLHNI